MEMGQTVSVDIPNRNEAANLVSKEDCKNHPRDQHGWTPAKPAYVVFWMLVCWSAAAAEAVMQVTTKMRACCVLDVGQPASDQHQHLFSIGDPQ